MTEPTEDERFMEMAEKIVEGLDPGQLTCVEHFKGPLLVSSTAGSGKTTAIVARLEYLVKVRKLTPSRLLAVTFSKNGAEEMAKRLAAKGVTGPRVGTFHSLAYEIVRKESPGKWEVDEGSRRFNLILKQVTGYQGMRWDSADQELLQFFVSKCKAWLAGPDDDYAMDLAAQLHAAGGESSDPEKLLEAYAKAEAARRDAGILTFDDQLVDAARLLEGDASLRARWAARWDHIIVDEAQDTSYVQARIAEALAQDHKNYVLVGDPSQLIHEWRGADVSFLRDFAAEWGAKVVNMDRTYRCAAPIVEAANHVLRRLGAKPMVAGSDHHGTVEVLGSTDFAAEAETLIDRVQLHVASGTPLKEIAILYRTHEQSQPIEDELLRKRIPYRVMGGVSFFERREVLNLLSYLRLVAGRGGVEDVKRSLRSPFRYLSAGILDRAAELSKNPEFGWRDIAEKAGARDRAKAALFAWASLLDDLGGDRYAEPRVLLRTVLAVTGFVGWLKKEEGEDSPESQRVRNVEECVRIAGKFSSHDEFLTYVDQTTKAARAARRKEKGDAVTLATGHAAKGLEWDVVLAAGVGDGTLPHFRAEITEERRLFYVMLTRARKDLIVSGVQPRFRGRDDDDGSNETPRFIRELGYGRGRD
jgi:DNA helicase-2/ATP-dependent DNA helicase PcrA